MSFSRWLGGTKTVLNSMSLLGRDIRILPRRYRRTVFSNAVATFRTISLEYKSAFVSTVTAAKTEPKKTFCYIVGCGLLIYCSELNPDELSFRDDLIKNIEEILLVPSSICSPVSVCKLQSLRKCYDEGQMQRISLGFVSVMWCSEGDIGLYETQCQYLKPPVTSLPSRLIDVGFLGKWWWMSLLMKDYDVNPDEFSGR